MEELRRRIERLTPEQRRQLDRRLAATAGPEAQQLVAYVVLRPGGELAALRPFLAERLPAYMVPARFQCINALPLMPNGKVDRHALSNTACPTPTPSAGIEADAPQGPNEEVLAQIWSAVLGCGPVGRHDDFFELGGDSILSIQVVSRAAQEGISIGVNQIFQNPTLAQLAATAAEPKDEVPAAEPEEEAAPVTFLPEQHRYFGSNGADSEDWPTLVPIRRVGDKAPLFLVHGLPGVVFDYMSLSRYLPADQPLYGLQASPVTYEETEPMAAHYLQAVQAVQPEGPYYLGGFCFGGVVAFEMARQLRAKQQEVALVIPIESMPPVGFRRNVHYWKHEIAKLSGKKLFERLRKKSLGYTKRLIRAVGSEEGGIAVEARDMYNMERYPQAYRPWAEKHFRALRDYQPAVYDGSIALIRVDSPTARGDTTLGWGTWTKSKVKVVEIEGKHGNLFEEPFVLGLGQALSACLAQTHTPPD